LKLSTSSSLNAANMEHPILYEENGKKVFTKGHTLKEFIPS